MRFSRKNLPKTRQQLDEFVVDNGLRPFGMIDYRGRHIFIAETDLELDRPIEYSFGYYQTAWFVNHPKSEEKLDVGRWLEFEAMHDLDKGWSQMEKRQARARLAIRDAQDWIDNSIEVGRMDA